MYQRIIENIINDKIGNFNPLKLRIDVGALW